MSDNMFDFDSINPFGSISNEPQKTDPEEPKFLFGMNKPKQEEFGSPTNPFGEIFSQQPAQTQPQNLFTPTPFPLQQQNIAVNEEVKPAANKSRLFQCPSCGAQLVTDAYGRIPDKCMYCGINLKETQKQEPIKREQLVSNDILDKYDPVKVRQVDETLAKMIKDGTIDDIPTLREAFNRLKLPYEAILSKKLSATGDAALNSDGICDSANAILIGGMELSL